MVMETTQRGARLVSLLGFVLLVLIWGSFPVAAKLGEQNAPPLLFFSARFLIATGLMALMARMQRKKLRITRRQHLHICVVSLFLVGIPAAIFSVSIPYAPAGVLTLMWATSPIFTSLFNVGGAGEVRGWRLFASLVIGAFGILIVLLGHIPFWPGTAGASVAFASSGPALIAELAVLASCIAYGLGMRLAKRDSSEVPVVVFTTWQLFYCGVFIGIMGLIFERGYVFTPTWTTLGALLYVAIFCSCISFFLMFWLIRRIGAIRTSYSDFIIPGVTLILSALLLGESLTLAKIGGFVLVILGCFLVEM